MECLGRSQGVLEPYHTSFYLTVEQWGSMQDEGTLQDKTHQGIDAVQPGAHIDYIELVMHMFVCLR